MLIDRAAVEALGIRVLEADLLAPGDEFIRHDPTELARAVMELLDHA